MPATETVVEIVAVAASRFMASDFLAEQLYEVATEDPAWKGLVQLVRIHPGGGRVQLSRVLDADWRIAVRGV